MEERISYLDYEDTKHRSDVKNLIKILQSYEMEIDDQLAIPTEQYCDETIADFLENCELKDGKLLLAIYDGEIAGFIVLWQETDSSLYPLGYKWYSIEALVVRPQYRRMKIAKGLMVQAEKLAYSREIKQLRVNVLAANSLGLSAYSSSGFVPFEIILKKNL